MVDHDQVLACLVFTSMCVTALLLGRRASGTMDRGIAAIIAALCMLPCRTILPFLYRSANGPPEEHGARRRRRVVRQAPRGRPGSVLPLSSHSSHPSGAAAGMTPFVRGGTAVLKSSAWPTE